MLTSGLCCAGSPSPVGNRSAGAAVGIIRVLPRRKAAHPWVGIDPAPPSRVWFSPWPSPSAQCRHGYTFALFRQTRALAKARSRCGPLHSEEVASRRCGGARAESRACPRGTGIGRKLFCMRANKSRHGIPAQRLSAKANEQRFIWCRVPFRQPCAENLGAVFS